MDTNHEAHARGAAFTQLGERLLPVYLVSGSEPLLVGEAADQIRARARLEGYGEREVFFIERGSGHLGRGVKWRVPVAVRGAAGGRHSLPAASPVRRGGGIAAAISTLPARISCC